MGHPGAKPEKALYVSIYFHHWNKKLRTGWEARRAESFQPQHLRSADSLMHKRAQPRSAEPPARPRFQKISHHCSMPLGFLLYLFIFNWRRIALQHCVVSALCQHQSAIGLCMSPRSWIFFPPPTPSHPSRLSQSTRFVTQQKITDTLSTVATTTTKWSLLNSLHLLYSLVLL